MKKILTLILLSGVLLLQSVMTVEAGSGVEYYYKTYDKSVTYEGKKATIKDSEKYKRVFLKGNSQAIKKINKTLKAACDAALKEMPQDYAKNDVEYRDFDDEYFNEHTSKVVYNQNGRISIVVSYFWYQGGVGDYGKDCFSFDLKTGKKLKLTDVYKTSNAKLTKKIKNALLKKYGKECFFMDAFNNISADKCDFYLKKGGKVVVVFDKYEIGPGSSGEFDITLNL